MQSTTMALQDSPGRGFSRSGPTCLPASSTAEPGCPSSTTLLPSGPHSVLLSRNSSPQADPSSRNTKPTLRTPLQMSAYKSFPWGLSRLPLPVLPQNLHFPFLDSSHLQRLYKQLPLSMPVPQRTSSVLSPCASRAFLQPGPEQAFHRDLVNATELTGTPAWHTGKWLGALRVPAQAPAGRRGDLNFLVCPMQGWAGQPIGPSHL